MHYSDHSLQYLSLTLALFLCTTCQQTENTQASFGHFEIHPQFQLEQVAAEPLVFDPVDLEFDEWGRAFVLEMPGYPLRDEESRVVLLEDTDEDGIFDQRHVYADGLGIASSIMPYQQGILVAAPPELIWLKDTNNDQTADIREVLMSGFSTGNLQHNYNGLTYALDNWIYASNGGNSGAPFFLSDSSSRIPLRGEDFRFRLGPKEIKRIGKTDWGFEIAFDSWGHLFHTHNLKHVSQRVFDQHYMEGLPTIPTHNLAVISDHEEAGLSRIYPIGAQDTRVNHPEQSGYFSGACGITHYGGNAFPKGLNESLFIADVVLNLVHIDILSPNGSILKASRNREKVEFLASDDRAFRPVNLATGPDGALYLVDMYREVIEHPEWIPDEIEETLDLTAGRDKGRIYRIRPKGQSLNQKVKLGRNDLEALIEGLAHPNQWVRMTSQRVLVESQQKKALPALVAMVNTSPSAAGRLHALWTLDGLGLLEKADLKKGLQDTAAGVRENAIKMVEKRLQKEPFFIAELLALAEDEDDRVRLQAALTLSTLSEEYYDAYAEEITFALARMLDHPRADVWTSLAVASANQHRPSFFCQRLFKHLSDSLSDVHHATITTLMRWVGQQGDGKRTGEMLKMIGQTELQAQFKVGMLDALNEGWKRSGTSTGEIDSLTYLQYSLALIEEKGPLDVLQAAGKLSRTLGFPLSPTVRRHTQEAITAALDSVHTPTDRLAYVKLAELADFSDRESLLYALLDNRQPLDIQKEALAQLWKASDPNIAPRLLELWPTLGPVARTQVGDILLYKESHHDLLLTALENNTIRPGELNLDLERRRELLWADNPDTKRRAEALFSDAGVVTRKEAIASMQPALHLAGDVANGQQLFEAMCSSCHQYGKLGNVVGPVLTEIHRKSKESLLHEILDPNAAVETRYVNHRIRTRNGDIYTGIVDSETDAEVTLIMTGGMKVSVHKAQIETLSSLGLSAMPEGLETGLTHEKMADLLAFLQQGP